jgi:urea transport system permease protein
MTSFCGRLVACVLALAFFLAAPPAFSQTLDDALTKFAADSFSDTDEGITALAASGSPRAITIIEALQAGQLAFDPASKKIFIREANRVLDAATGAAVDAPPDSLSTVRINNRLRRSIDAALGGLTLMSPDPRQRMASAQAVFKSRDAGALPALDAAIAKETTSSVKPALEQARAAVMLYKDDASEAAKIDAIGVIRNRGDQESIALLSGLPAN